MGNANPAALQDDGTLYLVMDHMSGGDLFDKIAGLAYCHQCKVSHRDIRPENYLLDNPGSNAELKLADFSLARIYATGVPLHTVLGIPSYVAPEVLRGTYDEKCDVWSVGVVDFLCCCGQLPIYEVSGDRSKFIQKVKAAEIEWSSIGKADPQMQAILRELLTVEATARPSAAKIAENAWLRVAGTTK